MISGVKRVNTQQISPSVTVCLGVGDNKSWVWVERDGNASRFESYWDGSDGRRAFVFRCENEKEKLNG